MESTDYITRDTQDDDWFDNIPLQMQGSEVEEDKEQLQKKKRKEVHDETTTAKASEVHFQ